MQQRQESEPLRAIYWHLFAFSDQNLPRPEWASGRRGNVPRLRRCRLSLSPVGGEYWAGIFKPLWSSGIDAKASTPPAYVACRAGTITLFLVDA
jgi:hypothetical protein